MNEIHWFTVVLSFIAVIGLILISAALLKFVINKGFLKIPTSKSKDLVIREIVAIDHKNKLCITSWRNQEYFLLVGESNILIDKHEIIS